jgi:hypothetical protein
MATQIQTSLEPFFKKPRTFTKRFPNGMPIGKRTERRSKENAKLNKQQIRHCELRISPNCAGNRMLTWCHATKSRFLLTDKDWQTACRGCLPCHQIIEAMSHKQMLRIVTDAIKRRKA